MIAREVAVFAGDTHPDHLGGDVTAIWQEALADIATIAVDIAHLTAQGLSGNEPAHRGRSC